MNTTEAKSDGLLEQALHGSGSPELCWVSYLLDYSGFAEHGRQCVAGLGRIGVRIQAVPIAPDPEFLKSYRGTDVQWIRDAVARTVAAGPCVFFLPPVSPVGQDFYAVLKAKNQCSGPYVAYTMFETTGLIPLWTELLKRMDEIWVPSRFNHETFTRAGLPESKIRVMPFGIDVNRFDPVRVKPLQLSEPTVFTFLSILQWTKRKGWDLLLRAYLQAFKRDDDVRLLLRANPFADSAPIRTQLDRFIARSGVPVDSAPKIELLQNPVPYDEYPGLFASADAFVLPSRGEGWGAPYMEAMAMELPTIGTRWSAQTDFMTDQNSFPVEVEKIVPVSADMVEKAWYFAGQEWAEPSVEHLAQVMRYVFENRQEAKKKGRQARRDMLSQWTIPQVIHKKVDRLRNLQITAKRVRRNASGSHAPVSVVIPVETPGQWSWQRMAELRRDTSLEAVDWVVARPNSLQLPKGDEPPFFKWVSVPGTYSWIRAVAAGLRATRGEFVAVLAPNLSAQIGWLEGLIPVLKEQPEVAVVGGRILSPQGRIAHSGLVESADGGCNEPLTGCQAFDARVMRSRDVAAFDGRYVLARRAALETVIGDCEAKNPADAAELCQRIKRIGYRLRYVPTGVVVETTGQPATSVSNHFSGETGKGLPVSKLSTTGDARIMAPTPRRGIHWAGHVFDYHGYAVHSRLCVESLCRRDVSIKLDPLRYSKRFMQELEPHEARRWKQMIEAPVDKGILVCFSVPTLLDGTDVYRSYRTKHPGCEAYIGMTTFETDRLPSGWVGPCNRMDEIWVPSRFNLESFARGGVDPGKLQVFPTGIDTDRYDPARVDPMVIRDAHGFIFLSVFQWTYRKGWDVLLQAYLKAFSKSDPVSLVLKIHPYTAATVSMRQHVAQYLASLGYSLATSPRIVVQEQMIPERAMPSLYAAADAFVLPTRGEGFGLPFLEAMAMGLPTLATRWSGHLDFMNDDNSFLIDVEKLVAVEPAQRQDSPFYEPDHHWAQPSIEHTATLMRLVFENRELAGRKGRQARLDIRRYRHLDRFGHWMVDRLENLEKGDRFPAVTDLGSDNRKSAWHSGGTRPEKQTIVWEAPIFDPSGYADEARHFIRQTTPAWPIKVHPVGRLSEEFARGMDAADREFFQKLAEKPVPKAFIHLIQAPGYALRRDPDSLYSIGRTTFETDRLPHDWVARCNVMDEVWVPSLFNQETFARAGVHVPVQVIPEGVDARFFRPLDDPLPIEGKRGFTFLSVFEWIFRKGWDVLLRAWVRAFRAEEEVCLLLRTYPLNQVEGRSATVEIKRRIEQFLLEQVGVHPSEVAPIIVLGNQIPQQHMPRLYAAAQAFVLPSRGEGWGRPYMEAMACGLPTLGTRWGGNTTFMNDDNSYLLDVEELSPVDDRMEFPHYHGHCWAEPSVEHLIRLLRRVFEDRAEAQTRGEQARRDVTEQWTWEHASTLVERRLQVIGEKLSVSATVRPSKVRPQADQAKTCVVWEGSQLVNHSFARINRELCRRLLERDELELSIVPYEAHEFSAESNGRYREIARHFHAPLSRPADIHLRHKWPPDFNPPPAGHWVMIQPWEYGRIPAAWVDPISRYVDKVWVPSRHTLKSYLASGVPADRVELVPNGVNTLQYRPDAPPVGVETKKSCKFLFVGGTIWRKGVDLLLQAYCRAFSALDDVVLVIKDMGQKSFYKGQGARDDILRLQSNPAGPAIVYLEEMLADDRMAGLYTACDCLVHPYRGEGFGMPVLEAMSCGLPVVVTQGGATDDFCDAENAYLIGARHRPFRSPTTQLAGGVGWVLEPDVAELASILREIYEQPTEARRKGRAGRSKALAYDWTHIAATVSACLEQVAQTPVRRFSTNH